MTSNSLSLSLTPRMSTSNAPMTHLIQTCNHYKCSISTALTAPRSNLKIRFWGTASKNINATMVIASFFFPKMQRVGCLLEEAFSTRSPIRHALLARTSLCVEVTVLNAAQILLSLSYTALNADFHLPLRLNALLGMIFKEGIIDRPHLSVISVASAAHYRKDTLTVIPIATSISAIAAT